MPGRYPSRIVLSWRLLLIQIDFQSVEVICVSTSLVEKLRNYLNLVRAQHNQTESFSSTSTPWRWKITITVGIIGFGKTSEHPLTRWIKRPYFQGKATFHRAISYCWEQRLILFADEPKWPFIKAQTACGCWSRGQNTTNPLAHKSIA